MSILTESELYSKFDDPKKKSKMRAVFSRLTRQEKITPEDALQQIAKTFATDATTACVRLQPYEEDTFATDFANVADFATNPAKSATPACVGLQPDEAVKKAPKTPEVLRTQLLQRKAMLWADLFKFVFIAVFSLLVFYHLVLATTTALGTDWAGWSKAVILELSVLIMGIYNPSKKHLAVFVKITFLLLVAASFFILHSGVEMQRIRAISTIEIEDMELSSFKDLRKKFSETYGALPKSRLTDRKAILMEISRLDSRIEKRALNFHGSKDVKKTNLHHDVEMTMRMIFLCIALITAHLAVKLGRRIYMPLISCLLKDSQDNPGAGS